MSHVTNGIWIRTVGDKVEVMIHDNDDEGLPNATLLSADEALGLVDGLIGSVNECLPTAARSQGRWVRRWDT